MKLNDLTNNIAAILHFQKFLECEQLIFRMNEERIQAIEYEFRTIVNLNESEENINNARLKAEFETAHTNAIALANYLRIFFDEIKIWNGGNKSDRQLNVKPRVLNRAVNQTQVLFAKFKNSIKKLNSLRSDCLESLTVLEDVVKKLRNVGEVPVLPQKKMWGSADSDENFSTNVPYHKSSMTIEDEYAAYIKKNAAEANHYGITLEKFRKKREAERGHEDGIREIVQQIISCFKGVNGGIVGVKSHVVVIMKYFDDHANEYGAKASQVSWENLFKKPVKLSPEELKRYFGDFSN